MALLNKAKNYQQSNRFKKASGINQDGRRKKPTCFFRYYEGIAKRRLEWEAAFFKSMKISKKSLRK